MRVRILGQYVQGSIAALAAFEMVMLIGALVLAVFIRFHDELSYVETGLGPLWPRLLVFSSVIVISLLAFGLYSPRQRAPMFGIFLRLVVAVIVGTAVTTVFFYFIPDIRIGRGVMMLAALASVAGLILSRTAFSRIVDEAIFKRRVIVYGAGRLALPIANLRRRADRRGFVLVGFVQPDGEAAAVPSDRLIRAGGTLRELSSRHNVDEVVLAMDDRRRAFPIRELLECRFAGMEVTEVPTFLERETGRVCVDVLNPSWMIFGQGFNRDAIRLFSARALDLVASSVIVVLSLPLILGTALAIKLEEGWRAPVFYRQARVGYGGVTFPLLKFRSMRTDAEVAGKPQWAQKNDPRVTRVGAIIRKLRIDELPQILNVLSGHMSFVGPRPERPEFVKELSEKIPYYVQRHSVKPGITGWAQLCFPYGSSEQDALEKLQYDLYYIKNNSLLFDLTILVQTAEVVFMGKGAR